MNGDSKELKNAKISMILGIIGCILWIFPIVGLPLSIVGLTFGLRGFNSEKKGMAIAGIVMGVIGIAFSATNAGIGCYMGATGQHSFVNKIFGQ